MGREVCISKADWQLTWQGLKLRGNRKLEAACIWGGRRRKNQEMVEGVYFIDDLLGVRRGRLYHRTSREATISLFETLRQRGHVIIADIHTHPRDWVDLSPTDAAHPIEYRKGLLALVLPFFATKKPDLLSVGIHEYVGSGEWRRLKGDEVMTTIRIQN
jgi:hypothetical protein